MSEKPEALRLADELDAVITPYCLESKAAAELRRLHAENERLRQINQSHEMKLSVRGYEIQIADLEAQRDEARRTVREAHEAGTRLTAQRDALLEEISALREVILYSVNNQGRYRKKHRKIIDAIIKAVEGEKT